MTFDMFAKVALKGSEVAPLYDWLQNPDTNPNFGGAVAWNFNKFLIGRSGTVVGRFLHKTDPLAPEVQAAIEKALQAQ